MSNSWDQSSTSTSRQSPNGTDGGACEIESTCAKVTRNMTSANPKAIAAFLLMAAHGPVAAQTNDPLEAVFEAALGSAGLATQTARFDPGILAFFQQSEFATPVFKTSHADPWRAPFYADMLRRTFAATNGKPHETVASAGRALGIGSRRSLLGNPIHAAEENAALDGALVRVFESMRSQGLITAAIPSLAGVPKATQTAAAVVLQVALDTVAYRRAAFAAAGDLAPHFRRLQTQSAEDEDPDALRRSLEFMRSVDLKFLFAGATDLAQAAASAEAQAQTVPPETRYRWSLETAWGQIVLTGGSNDEHPSKPTLLLIDTGGDDTYLSPATNASPVNWLSVCIDTAGDDKYLSASALADVAVAAWPERKNQTGGWGPASALCGIAILIDSAGDDLYRTHRPGLGSATFGVALLVDGAGQDRNEAYTNGQGYGNFGIGVLEDLAGDDVYEGFTQVQGCGQTAGVGVLLDRAGNDRYLANDQVIDFPSPQSAEHNVSMAQGAGNGRRADYLDAHSLSGGVGILYDQGGNDHYSCGVFGQGVGYWEGVGYLWDEGGDDTYVGQWYVQGASAHFAIGYLEDSSGDDTYTAGMNMAQGAGHDFGFGMLIDAGGSDKYTAPNLSLGAGNANGIGIFVDRGGNDTYASVGITLGSAAEAPKATLRERALCLGLFMDLGGTDTYPVAIDWAKNLGRSVNWIDRREPARESQLGIFWDR